MKTVWRNSQWDVVPFGLSLAHAALLLMAPSMLLIAAGLWWNSNTVSHNFVHLPFFQSRKMNAVYSMYLTVLLGVPQSWWRQRHLAHHSGNPHTIRFTKTILAEIAVVLGVWIFLLWLSPAFFLGAYVPGYLAGLGLCYIHGYFEHRLATTSNYGFLYNVSFLNDGYHVEHHLRPGEHWSRLRQRVCPNARASRWPAVFRWLEVVNLELLERIALRSKTIQRFLLQTHERAMRKLLAKISNVRQVIIVGGGMFPRTALILQKLLPGAEITIIDANARNLETARGFLSDRVKFINERYQTGKRAFADLLVIPLAFIGDRHEIYNDPPARVTLVHDWIWSRRSESATVSIALLKRLNLVRQ